VLVGSPKASQGCGTFNHRVGHELFLVTFEVLLRSEIECNVG
jgi:hypothetical protein